MSSATTAAPAPADGAEADDAAAPRPWFRPALIAVVAVAAALRIVYTLVVTARHPVGGDAYFYHHSAELLAHGHGLIVPFEYLVFGVHTQAADHPPLFIAYLTLWSLVGLGTVKAHLVAGALLGAVTVALTGLLGRRLAGPTVGIVAAAIAAIYPNLFSWDAMLLSEPTATIGVLLVCLAAYAYHDHPDLRSVALLGAATGVAALTRAELLLLSVLVVVPVVLGRRRLPPPDRLRHLVLAGVACVAVITPWIAWNLSRFEQPVYLSTGLDVTLAYTNCDSVYSGPLIGYWDFACSGVAFGTDDPGYLALDQSQRNEEFRAQALDYARAHKGRLPAVVLARIGRVAGVFRPAQQIDLDVLVEGRDRWVAETGMWMFYVLAVASMAGFVVLGRRRVIRYPLVGPVVTVAVAAAMTFGATRYRAAAEPILCILAAVAFVALARWRTQRAAPGDGADGGHLAEGESA